MDLSELMNMLYSRASARYEPTVDEIGWIGACEAVPLTNCDSEELECAMSQWQRKRVNRHLKVNWRTVLPANPCNT